MKRILVIVLVLAFFIVALGVWFTQHKPTSAEETVTRQAIPVGRGDIVSTVKATGNLEAEDEIELSFEMSGSVEDVYVKRGQEVKAGQPLAKLDTTSLELAVSQAELSLEQAKIELAQVQDDVDPDDLASARAALASAQAKYDALLAGYNEDEITVAAADLRTTEVTLEQAQGDYDRVAYKGGVGASAEAMALQEATIAHAKALANYNIAMAAADDEELKAAEAEIISAQTTLNNLLQGASDEEIALAESQVKAAQLSLDSAMRDLEEATLVAPIAATVTAVNIQKGERTTEGDAGNVAIVLTQLFPLHIDVEIDEIDVPLIDVGQPAAITIDALPDDTLSGVVSEIAPAPVSVDDGVVSYEVSVTLNNQGEKARPGMTSNVDIETSRRTGVLLIPSTVIQVDETSGQTYVEKQGSNGEPVRVDVTLGDRSDERVEVVSGLADGEMVLIPEGTLKTGQFSSGNSAGTPRMMPMGPMMGGPPAGAGRSGGGSGPR